MPLIPRGPTHDIPYLDIRTDDDVVVFRGSATESSGSHLKGRLVLCVKEATSVKSITLSLQGLKRIQWGERPTQQNAGLLSSRAIKHDDVFWEHKWPFVETPTIIKPGNYEYPFDVVLKGDLYESLEGLSNAHVIYRLKAKIVRGTFSHDIVAKKHLRIIRTITPESLELSQTVNVDNTWVNKIEYSISVPTKAVVFGTYIPIDLVLVPRLKGLTIGKVTCALWEIQTITSAIHKNVSKEEPRVVCTQVFNNGEFADEESEDAGKWCLKDRVNLPKSLDRCVQDCEIESIKIRHKLRFTIALHNPDGHMSELRASLPVMLFISPQYLMDDTNTIPSTLDTSSSEIDASAPPRYDLHTLDPSYVDTLYSNIPMASFDTPLPSAFNSPVMSRANSSENLASLASVAESTEEMDADSYPATPAYSPSEPRSPMVLDSPASTAPSGITPLTLPPANSDRWQRPQRRSTSPDEITDYLRRSGNSSRASSPRRESGNGGLTAAQLETISRVPSYNTALKSVTKNLVDTPAYEDVVGLGMGVRSAPGSPTLRPRLMGRAQTEVGGMGAHAPSRRHTLFGRV